MLFLLPSDFDQRDVDDLNVILEKKLQAHLAAKCLYRKVMATSSGAPEDPGDSKASPATLPERPALSPICPDCDWMAEDGGGYCATHRRACEGCGRNAVELHEGDFSRTKLARDGKPIVELWCLDCGPITEPRWSLADEEEVEPWGR